jgi:hypothetical protein
MQRRVLAGRCFCGAVGYAVIDEFAYAGNCHCSNCRRTTGAAFKPFAGIERGKLVVNKGRENVMIFGQDDANDTHCNRCGSLLYSVVRAGAFETARRLTACGRWYRRRTTRLPNGRVSASWSLSSASATAHKNDRRACHKRFAAGVSMSKPRETLEEIWPAPPESPRPRSPAFTGAC